MTGSWRRRFALIGAVLLCATIGLAQAQGNDGDDSADPPSRVARLSFIDGDVGMLPSGASDWGDARINRPITRGDRLSTGRDARAELELGGGALRIAGKTDVGLLDMNDQLTQVELTQGTLNIRARHFDRGQSYEIDTPTVALVVDQPGTFRVDVDRFGDTTVTAFDGTATVYGANNAQRTILENSSYEFDDSSLESVTISDIGSGDDFDAWCSERDNRYARSTSRQYVSDDVVGYQDLDQYGNWQTTSDYGPMWFPSNVGSDWAPYRQGHWAYIAPWGWTWVDDSAWGFAPYHYGRWAYVRGNWGWIPGPIGVRPIYAPALVAFVGGGGWSVGIGVGSGPVGWFPLGPGEIYNPWYHASRNYYTNVNVTNINVHNTYNHTTIINNINNQYVNYRDNRPNPRDHYVNRDAPRGFTAVPAQAFAAGKPVRGEVLRIDQRELAKAPVMPRGATVRPMSNVETGPVSERARRLPTGDFSREVMARHLPPAEIVTRGPDAGTGRPVPTNNNVRLLGTRPGNDRGSGPAGTNPQRGTFSRGGNPASPGVAPMQGGHDMLNRTQSGEMPSARFAHPQRGDRFGDPSGGRPVGRFSPQSAPAREIMPRNDTGNGEQATPDMSRMRRSEAATLPQAPQIQRATPIENLPPQNANERPQRTFNTPRQEPAMQREYSPQQERPAERNVIELPAAARVPERIEPMRPAYQPHFQPPPPPEPQATPQQRPMPQLNAPPRAEPAARPQREAAPRPEPRPHVRGDKQDEQQH